MNRDVSLYFGNIFHFTTIPFPVNKYESKKSFPHYETSFTKPN